ncbi:Amino-acid acetyltransferase, mitochondrial [Tilletia horrida]|uniref:Amino-acid acetyltransferase, mitochondrial n=1 Tax=Tilletia horrida TaxID=155126 RepID=A0AAN6GVH8_9BASI|nr:Amino-acid acetyltransferase, mitochondrial [Tilletia horrida]KAK0569094.1 Amino-acid acetyltransferase, mitochondrial [Tilletia horrida]
MSANASRSRIQSLVLEVLNAHPSARDSKAYLQSFGISMPPPSSNPAQQQQQISQTTPPSPIPIGGSSSPAFHFTQHTALVKVQGPFSDRQLSSIADGLVYLKRLGLMSILILDSERWPTASARFNQQGQLLVPRALLSPESKLTPARQAQQQNPQVAAIAGAASVSGSAPGALSRTPAALVGKAQEGLRRRMNHQVLRLSSLLEARGAPSLPITQPAFRIDHDTVSQLHARLPAPAPARQTSHASSSSDNGARSPFPKPSQNQDELSIYHSPLSGRAPLVSSDALAAIRAALLSDQLPVLSPIALYEDPHDEGSERALAVSTDDAMVALAREMSDAAIQAAKRRKQLSSEALRQGEDETDALVSAALTEQDDLDLMPLRLMVINREGGIPSHARGGNPHLSINLASEYSQIHRTFIWNRSHLSALRNLRTVKDCLAYMPHPTSSGVVVSHRSPKSLIANLITNKAAHSPSLPHRLLEGRNDVRHTPTIVRWGLPVRVLERYEDLELEKLADLLEISFGKKLDRVNYFERLRKRLDFVIVAGDYQGAAIVTKEWAPGEEEEKAAEAKERASKTASNASSGAGSALLPDEEVDANAASKLIDSITDTSQEPLSVPLEPIAYLDKFAVLPSLRGSGVVDFLWGALRDEVHGLGLLDALNENGGKGGFGAGRDLVWKSRGENTVNRWYFERSNGFVRIPAGGKVSKISDGQVVAAGEEEERLPWVMFWCDAEERLANMSGEKRLGAEATYEDVLDMAVDREKRRLEEEEEEAYERQIGAEERMRRMWGEDVDGEEAFGRRASSESPNGGRQMAPSSISSHGSPGSASPLWSSDSSSHTSQSSATSDRYGFGADSSGSARSSFESTIEVTGNLFTRLPHIAPEERGRLDRWARCMASIPSAWI